MNKILIILFLLIYNLFLFTTPSFSEDNKIKIGLLVPLTGENSKIGKQIVQATRLALIDINSDKIEIFPKDTNSDPNKTLRSAIELSQLGINLIIGPVFYENLIYLDEVKNVTFLSFTNKTLDLPENVISTGINSTSQFNTINKFIEQNEIDKKILLTPNLNYDQEIENGIKKSKLKVLNNIFMILSPQNLQNKLKKLPIMKFVNKIYLMKSQD
jgi:ABC-type branched-subunit amino acid transport system substrate-binding protein